MNININTNLFILILSFFFIISVILAWDSIFSLRALGIWYGFGLLLLSWIILTHLDIKIKQDKKRRGKNV